MPTPDAAARGTPLEQQTLAELVWPSTLDRSVVVSALLIGAGVLTSIPLLCFALAARRMDLSTLGFVQFLSPTLAFMLGLFVFHEPLRPVQLGSFVLIWAAIGLFVADLLARRRARVRT